ncbi:MAG: His/Gly/Thr/Pro-type tRNA ligase C-terminal domain-containing protein, partial [Nitrososphaeraceae archaeon]
KTKKTSFKLAYDLRMRGVSVEMDYENKSLKSQLRRADKLGSKFAVSKGTLPFKNIFGARLYVYSQGCEDRICWPTTPYHSA